jgi:hypothetical protein
MQHLHSQDALEQSYVLEWISRIRSRSIHVLMLGSCGKYSGAVLSEVPELLFMLLQSTSSMNDADVESYILSTLHQNDHFALGDHAREITYKFLLRCAREGKFRYSATDNCSTKSLGILHLSAFLSDVWNLHQIEDPSALPGSDGVDRFISQYDSGSSVQ